MKLRATVSTTSIFYRYLYMDKLNEELFAKKIAAELQRSPISMNAQSRLVLARQSAMQAFRHQESLGLTGHVLALSQIPSVFSFMAVLLIATFLTVSTQINLAESAKDAADFDALALSAATPPEAYADKDFLRAISMGALNPDGMAEPTNESQ